MIDPVAIADAISFAAVDVFIVRAIERDSVRSDRTNNSMHLTKGAGSNNLGGQNHYLGERIQGIKAMQRICKVAPLCVPRSIVFSIDAVARDKSDPFRIVCIEALRELAVTNPRLVSECFGMSTLFDAVLDPSLVDPGIYSSSSSTATKATHHSPKFLKSLRESIVLSLLHIANSPGGRRYLHSGPMGGSIDFRRLLSPLVDPDYPSPSTRGKQNPKKQETGREPGVRRQVGTNKLAGSGGGKNRLSDRLRWQAASGRLLMMRTWQGVILLASDRQGGLRALFSMLVHPFL